uniref:Uncharacterized protein n=1 Tax=Lactuca sativa TaxID=4236 RepID=A0A9R1X447_LACSA|nr:hypothetical protein LSAT_V11C700355960 [Lactuca sativa]
MFRRWLEIMNEAETQELEGYASLLSHYKGSRKRVGGLKLEELPGLEALQVPGTKDGQTIVVREGDNGVAYAWNRQNQTWDKFLKEYNMIMVSLLTFDYFFVFFCTDTIKTCKYVFDVDIGDGEPIRKLAYSVDVHNSDSIGMES